jgi:hypothetical protein
MVLAGQLRVGFEFQLLLVEVRVGIGHGLDSMNSIQIANSAT